MTSSQRTGMGFVLFATGVTAIGGFLFGYDTAVINGANSYLTAHMNLTPAQEGLAGASAVLGCIPGAMFAGFLSDRFGRRSMLFLCALLYAVSGLLSAIPSTLDQFLWARFVSGLGIGASSMICPVYIAEIAPERWRGRLGTLFQLGIVTGIFLTLFVNKLIQGMGDEAWNIAMGWRWMLGMEVVPAIAFIALLFAVPESPRWLAQKGREAEARSVLTKVDGPEHAENELAAIREASQQEEGRFSELFHGPFRRPLVLACVLMACSQFCGINAVIYYSTQIFESAGGSKDAAFSSSVWVGLINLLFTFVALGLVDKAGRKPLLLIGTAVQVVALAMVGFMFWVAQHNAIDGILYIDILGLKGSLTTGQNNFALLISVTVFIGAFAMSLGPIGWLFCSEVFPNKLRGRAMSVAAFVVWVACYVVAQTFPMLKAHPNIGPAKTFWVYAAVSAFTFVFTLLFIPETKGRTLEEIETSWKNSSAGQAHKVDA